MKLVEQAIFTEKVSEMTTYYETLLGQPPVAKSEDMAIFMLGETKLFIHRMYEAKEGDLPPENHTALAVSDVDAECARLKEKGLNIEVPPANYYWGRSAYLRDPAGRLLELIQE